MTIDMDSATNRLLGLGVNAYLGRPQHTDTLAVVRGVAYAWELR